MATKALVRRRYLFPCSGYVSSVRKGVAPLSAMTADSRDWQVSPNEGQWISRKGSSFQGAASEVLYSPTGLLEFKGSMLPRRLVEFESPTLLTGYPTWSGLYGNEASTARYGQLVVRSHNTGALHDHTFGEEFSTTTYPVNSTTELPVFKMVPMPYVTEGTSGVTKATGYTRCAFEFARRYLAQGSRSVRQVGDNAYLPNFLGVPACWFGKRWNDTTSTTSNITRFGPWGHRQPMFPPTVAAGTASSGTDDKNWWDGDTFYVSTIFQYKDGSFSLPFLNRPVSSTVTAAKGGLIQVGTVGGTGSYRGLAVTNIAIGGPDVVARLIVMTRVENVATSAPPAGAPTRFGQGSVANLDPGQLFIAAVIKNNSQTSYILGPISNESLRQDDAIIRFDHIWPPASRYAIEFDQRMLVGYSRLNPCAIIIAPSGTTSSRDMNVDDENSTGTNIKLMPHFFVRVVSGAIQLVLTDATSDTTLAVVSVTTSASVTLQTVVDEINATLVGGTAREWCAQLAPGVDPNISSDKLALTQIDVASCTLVNTSTITVAGSGFADVAIGMKVFVVSGTGTIPANSIVIAKASNGSITIGDTSGGAAVTTAGTATLGFFTDTGDEANINVSGQKGYVRAYCPALPAVLAFKASFLDTYAPVDKRSVWFTESSPGTASMAASSFFNSLRNRRSVPATAGIFMGAAPLSRGAVLCYSNAIYTLENRKGGTTGEDQDYRAYPLNLNRGCISPYSIVHGDGWVGYLTREGYFVTDGEREVCLTGDIWDPGTKRGNLETTIPLCAAAASSDSDAFDFFAHVDGTRLRIAYRSSTGVGPLGSDRVQQVYDFSQGVEGSGLGEVVRSDGRPFGWSAPLTLRHSAMATVGTEDGAVLLGCIEDNLGSAGDGRVDMLDVTLPGGNCYDEGETTEGSPNYAVFCTWSSAGASPTVLTGNFTNVAVGAYIGTSVVGAAPPTGLTAGWRVIAIAANRASATINNSVTNTSSGFVTFYGKKIKPIGYMAMDAFDEPRRRKALERVVLFCMNSGDIMSLLISRDRDRATQRSISILSDGAQELTARKLEAPVASRSGGDVLEFGISAEVIGTPVPEVWGLEAEVEILDSYL